MSFVEYDDHLALSRLEECGQLLMAEVRENSPGNGKASKERSSAATAKWGVVLSFIAEIGAGALP
jgi:hypothetical protein